MTDKWSKPVVPAPSNIQPGSLKTITENKLATFAVGRL
jgi:hypothetical protein